MAKGPYSVFLRDNADLAALAALGLDFTPATQGGGTVISGPNTFPASLVPRKTITVTADTAFAPFNGDLYVQVDADYNQVLTLTLPALNGAKPGNRLIFYRLPPDPQLDPPSYDAAYIVTANVADRLNGFQTANTAGRLALHGRDHLIIIERTLTGWISMSSDEAGTTSQSQIIADTDVAAWSGLKTFLVDSATAVTIRLPTPDSVPDGSRALFRSITATTGRHRIAATGGANINGLATIDLALNAPLELVAVPGRWIAVGPTPTALNEQTLTGAGQVQAVHGTDLLVRVNFAASGNAVLPALADCDIGASITFLRESGNGVPCIVPNDNADEINGLADITYSPYFMRALQDSVTYKRVEGGWIRDQGTEVGILVSGATDPLVVPTRAQGTQYVLSTGAAGQVISLASLSLGRPGYRVVVQNGSANDHEVHGTGGNLINGGAIYPLLSGEVAIIEHAGTEWFAVKS